LFGVLQRDIHHADAESVRRDLTDSEMYDRFVRGSSTFFRQCLSGTDITRLDLLTVQHRLDAMGELDPVQKQFYDSWLVPRLRGDARREENAKQPFDQIFRKHARHVRQTFRSIRPHIQSVGKLARLHWLIVRQWNFLVVELQQRLDSLEFVPTTTSKDGHQDNEHEDGQQKQHTEHND